MSGTTDVMTGATDAVSVGGITVHSTGDCGALWVTRDVATFVDGNVDTYVILYPARF